MFVVTSGRPEWQLRGHNGNHAPENSMEKRIWHHAAQSCERLRREGGSNSCRGRSHIRVHSRAVRLSLEFDVGAGLRGPEFPS